MENNKNKKFVKFQGDMLNFSVFIQVFVFTPNHHLNMNTFTLLVLYTDFSNHTQTFLTGVLEFNLFTYCRHDVRLASLIVFRALARASLVCI